MVKNKDQSVVYSIAFLKLAIGGVLLLIAVICAMILYELVLNPVDRQKAGFFYPVFAGIYISLVPVFYSGFQCFKLLNALKEGLQFKTEKAAAVKKLRLASAACLSVLLVLFPFVYRLAEASDTPELILIFGIPVLFSLIWLAVLTIFQDT